MHVRAATKPAAGRRQTALDELPEWDLSDLYPGRDSEALKHDLSRLAGDAEAFRESHQDHLRSEEHDRTGDKDFNHIETPPRLILLFPLPA